MWTAPSPTEARRMNRSSECCKEPENRKGDQLDDHQQHETGHRFSEKKRPAANGGDQDFETVVRQLAGEAAIHYQRTRERVHQPKEASRDGEFFIAVQIEREAEQHQ